MRLGSLASKLVMEEQEEMVNSVKIKVMVDTESELGGSASAAQTTLIIKNNMSDSVPVFMSFNANGDACTNNMDNTSISFCKPVPGGNVCTFKIAGGATLPIPNAPGKNLCGGLYFYGNGMEVVKKIQRLKDKSQMLLDKVAIHSITILEK